MRKLIIWICTLFIAFTTSAQDSNSLESVNFDHLRSPSNPGFSVLDLEPTSVSRPKSPQKFGVALLSGVTEGGIPKFAIETAPYWWKSNPELTFQEYINPGVIQSAKQTFSLSLATRQLDEANLRTTGTSMGMGLRFQPISGKLNQKAKETLTMVKSNNQLMHIIDNMRAFADRFPDTQAIKQNIWQQIEESEKIEEKKIAKKFVFSIIDTMNFTPENKRKYFEKLKAGIKQAGKDKVLAFQTLDKQRVGWIMEISAASALNFPANTFDRSRIHKAGSWINLSYKPEETKLELTLLGRYFTDFADTTTSSLEGGIGIGYTSKDFTMLLEGIAKQYDYETWAMENGERIKTSKSEFTYRLAVNFNYRITESIYISVTFGKEHDKPWEITKGGDLLTMFGLNLAAPTKANLSKGK